MVGMPSPFEEVVTGEAEVRRCSGCRVGAVAGWVQNGTITRGSRCASCERARSSGRARSRRCAASGGRPRGQSGLSAASGCRTSRTSPGDVIETYDLRRSPQLTAAGCQGAGISRTRGSIHYVAQRTRLGGASPAVLVSLSARQSALAGGRVSDLVLLSRWSTVAPSLCTAVRPRGPSLAATLQQEQDAGDQETD